MTAIVNPRHFGSKAKLQQRLEETQGRIVIDDPSIVAPRCELARDFLKAGESVVVTSHPLRTKFAKITRTGDNSWKVS